MRKDKLGKNVKWILCAAILSLCFFLIQTDELQIASATDVKDVLNHSTTNAEISNEDQTLSHEQIIALTDQFMETLVQKTEDNKVINFDTKEKLLHAFDDIATKKVASTYVDYYYYEEADGLYMIPTETPPWFNKENDYNVVQLGNNKVKVEQENESALSGSYTVAYEFTFDKTWKITKITHG
ncbi:MAG TPA: hypothetical protein VK091_07185 [Virgibacillus sp.]|nr:hypothetical protein [Virgibacillus sp.]